MRILHLVQQPVRRGAEVFAAQLSREFIARGHTCKTLYLYPYEGPDELAFAPGDECLGGNPHHTLERWGVQPSLLRKIRRLVALFQPDVIQLNGARTVKYGAVLRRLERGAAWVVVYRNIGNPSDWISDVARVAFYRWIVFPGMDGIVALSDRSRRVLRDSFGVTAPVVIIPNGVPSEGGAATRSRTEMRRAADTPDDAVVVLSVGRLGPEKRIDRLLRVFRAARQRYTQAYLWIVGDGPERLALEELTRDLGLLDVVRFRGSTSDVGSYYGAVDVMMLTSDTEGVPAVLLEAGLAGLPVVATRVGSIPTCIVDGQTGLLADASDEDALKRNLEGFLSSRERRVSFGVAGRSFVSTHFLMSRVADLYEAFYRELLARLAPH